MTQFDKPLNYAIFSFHAGLKIIFEFESQPNMNRRFVQKKPSVVRKKFSSNCITVAMNPPAERKILKASRKIKPPEAKQTTISQRNQGKSVSKNSLPANPSKMFNSDRPKHVDSKKLSKHEIVKDTSQPRKSKSGPQIFQKQTEVRPITEKSSKCSSACGATSSEPRLFASFKIPKKKTENSSNKERTGPISSHFSQHDSKSKFENKVCTDHSKIAQSLQLPQSSNVASNMEEARDIDFVRSNVPTISNCDYYDRPLHVNLSGSSVSINPTTIAQSSTITAPTACEDSAKDLSLGGMEDDMEWETTINEIKTLWSAESVKSDNQKTPSAVSEEIDMEIDFEPCRQVVIVPDTNIWIHSLSFIRAVLETKLHTFSYPTLVIPWMVLQELDFKGKTGGSGRPAINYIHKLLSSNHPRVKGQRAADAAVVNPEFQRMNADDSILQCAQQQQTNTNKVILITSDRNMKNKALVNGMLVVDSCSGTSALTEALKQNANNNNHQLSKFQAGATPTPLPWNNPFPKQVSKRRNSDNLESAKKAKQDDKASPETSFQEIIRVVETTLSHVITLKMKEDYGDPDWLNVIKIPPPWVFRSALQCIIKHWQVVFSEVFGRRVSAAEKVLNLLQRYKPGSPKALEDDIVDSVIGLFNAGEFAESDILRKDEQVRICRELLLNHMKV